MTQHDTTTMENEIVPFSLKDAPALIEKLLPVQKLSVEIYKERTAGTGQTLTALGSYWKGRKPLVLAKACVLGALLPITDDPRKDLEAFELLMGMDDASMGRRATSVRPRDILKMTEIKDVDYYFTFSPTTLEVPASSPFDTENIGVKPRWKRGLPDSEKRKVITLYLASLPFKERVRVVERADTLSQEELYAPIWEAVNAHLGTSASSFPQLLDQLGVMRFGHRPRLADTFAGSGQILFEAARLGCDVYGSDLNPVACLLTWGAFNVVGASKEKHAELESQQAELVAQVKSEIDNLEFEAEREGWTAKTYLYCLEIVDPVTGWKIPILPSRVISRDKKSLARLLPVAAERRYELEIISGASDDELKAAEVGTYRNESVVYTIDGVEYSTKLSTIRGDHTDAQGARRNRLRRWDIHDVTFRQNDIFNERLYAIQWIQNSEPKSQRQVEFRSVTEDDLRREQLVNEYVTAHLAEWQEAGWVPDMRIEPGYNTDQPIRERGWTYWHHLFNPRQLLTLKMMFKAAQGNAALLVACAGVLDRTSRLCAWGTSKGRDAPVNVFANQALNTLFTYGAYSGYELTRIADKAIYREHELLFGRQEIVNSPADGVRSLSDIFITDPPYGDAVKYEEIYEFFIAWLRKNPPPEFADWTWDSRRALAIKGEDHNFKAEMVAAYKAMTNCMPDNGIQIVMFTHQSGAIWADMSNIVWASGLQVSAAWYVVTETDSVLRKGQYIKGTILLVLRKRLNNKATSRDELAYEIEDEVKSQVELLTGLNQDTKDLYRDENLFEDADLQMAGYAAALRVLTKYTTIDGVDMTQEALRPRVKKQKTLVDELIDFAVAKANEYLVPQGLTQDVWDKLIGIERFYLKMVDMESKDIFVLSNYQNFAKAFKVQDFSPLMAETKANNARLKDAVTLNKRYMGASDEFGPTLVRTVLYGIYQLASTSVGGDRVIAEVKSLVANYYQNRELLIAISDYLAKKRATTNPEESSAAGILRDLVRNERM